MALLSGSLLKPLTTTTVAPKLPTTTTPTAPVATAPRTNTLSGGLLTPKTATTTTTATQAPLTPAAPVAPSLPKTTAAAAPVAAAAPTQQWSDVWNEYTAPKTTTALAQPVTPQQPVLPQAPMLPTPSVAAQYPVAREPPPPQTISQGVGADPGTGAGSTQNQIQPGRAEIDTGGLPTNPYTQVNSGGVGDLATTPENAGSANAPIDLVNRGYGEPPSAASGTQQDLQVLPADLKLPTEQLQPVGPVGNLAQTPDIAGSVNADSNALAAEPGAPMDMGEFPTGTPQDVNAAGVGEVAGTPDIAGSLTLDPKQQALVDKMGADPNAGAAGAGGEGNPDFNKQWSDIWNEYQGGLDDTLAQADIAAGTQARRNSEMNATMGGNVGGQFQSGMAQANLTGQQLRMQAKQKHLQKGMEMKMAWLDQQIKMAESNNNRNLARELQAQQDTLSRDLAAMNVDNTSPLAEAAGPSDGDKALDWTFGDNSVYGKTKNYLHGLEYNDPSSWIGK